MIIGIAGNAGAGKTTALNFLKAKHKNIEILNFADELKEVICKQLLNLTDEQLYGSLKECIDTRYDMSPREIFQRVGDGMREIDPNIWVKRTMLKVFRSRAKVVLIGDVRRPNEAEAIKNAGGYIWLIKRLDSGIKNELKEHTSETDVLKIRDIDEVIENNGSLASFLERIDDVYYKTKKTCDRRTREV